MYMVCGKNSMFIMVIRICCCCFYSFYCSTTSNRWVKKICIELHMRIVL
jgi:hypothetical protein